MPSAKTSLAAAFALAACGLSEQDRAPTATAPSAEISSSSAPSAPSAIAPPAPDARLVAGAAAYAKYCALCHGGDATGYAADHAPSLVSSTFLATADDAFLARSIQEGRPGTPMAAYSRARGGPLDDAEVSVLVAFLRAKAPPPIALSGGAALGDAARGIALYEANCRRCHGTKEARGEAVHLANPAFLSAASDGFLRFAISNGRPGTAMQAYGTPLGEPAVADLVALLRSWAPKAAEARPPAPPKAVPKGPIVLHPQGKPPQFSLRDGRFVPADQVKRALEQGRRMVVIDARPSSDWLVMHIPGAISIPYYELGPLDGVPNDGTWVVAYCGCPHHASGVVVDELRRRGVQHSAVLDEGILEWEKRGYPLDRSAAPGGSGSAPSAPPTAPHR